MMSKFGYKIFTKFLFILVLCRSLQNTFCCRLNNVTLTLPVQNHVEAWLIVLDGIWVKYRDTDRLCCIKYWCSWKTQSCPERSVCFFRVPDLYTTERPVCFFRVPDLHTTKRPVCFFRLPDLYTTERPVCFFRLPDLYFTGLDSLLTPDMSRNPLHPLKC